MKPKKHVSRLLMRIAALALLAGIAAAVVAILFVTSPLRETPPAMGASGANGGPRLNPEDINVPVRQHDFGAWKYTATRNDVEGLHASVSYDRDTIAGIKAYAAANRALLPQVVKDGGTADVAVTFAYAVPVDWFRTWARTNGFQVTQALLRTGAPGTAGGTVGIGGTADDPLPQSSIDNMMGGFFANDVYGVFGAYGKVDASKLSGMVSEPKVFLVDVTPNVVRRDLRQNGITDALQQPPRVELPFAPMERLGLQNFTNLPLPTQVPAPVGTAVPKVGPVAP